MHENDIRYRAFRWALANEHDPLMATWTDMQAAMRSDNAPTPENIDAMMDALADFLIEHYVTF